MTYPHSSSCCKSNIWHWQVESVYTSPPHKCAGYRDSWAEIASKAAFVFSGTLATGQPNSLATCRFYLPVARPQMVNTDAGMWWTIFGMPWSSQNISIYRSNMVPMSCGLRLCHPCQQMDAQCQIMWLKYFLFKCCTFSFGNVVTKWAHCLHGGKCRDSRPIYNIPLRKWR